MGTSHSVAPREFSLKPGTVSIIALAVAMRESVLYISLIDDAVFVNGLSTSLDKHAVFKHTFKPVSVRHGNLAFYQHIIPEASLADNLQVRNRGSDHDLDTCRLDESSLAITGRDIIENKCKFILADDIGIHRLLLLRYLHLNRFAILKLAPEDRTVSAIQFSCTMAVSVNTCSLINGTVLIYTAHISLNQSYFREPAFIP